MGLMKVNGFLQHPADKFLVHRRPPHRRPLPDPVQDFVAGARPLDLPRHALHGIRNLTITSHLHLDVPMTEAPINAALLRLPAMEDQEEDIHPDVEDHHGPITTDDRDLMVDDDYGPMMDDDYGYDMGPGVAADDFVPADADMEGGLAGAHSDHDLPDGMAAPHHHGTFIFNLVPLIP